MFKWLAGETVNKATDTISKMAQVIGLVIAGLWVYKTYFESVEPGLEFRGTLGTELTWTKSSNSLDCLGTLNVIVGNDGLKSFNISQVHIRGWLYTSDPEISGGSMNVPIPKPTPTNPVPIDVAQIEANPTFYDKLYPDRKKPTDSTILTTHYPPGARSHQRWDFIFKKTPGQGVIFRADVTTSEKITQFLPEAYISADTCTLPDTGTPATNTAPTAAKTPDKPNAPKKPTN
jgi:hypothetical protein